MLRRLLSGFLVALLGACASVQGPQEGADRSVRSYPLQGTKQIDRAAGAKQTAQAVPAERAQLFKGTGVLVVEPPSLPGQPDAARGTRGSVSLNFEGADLREVVRSILGDTLNKTYVVDPAVSGTVTMRTAAPIPTDALMPTLETLLRMNGHTLVEEAGIFKVVPAAVAVRGNVTPQLGNSSRPLPAGYSVRIVPLRFVGVRDMLRLLEPFAKDAATIRIDEVRNLVILAGTERELQHLLRTVEMFDVDWMEGMSAGLFQLQSADIKQVMNELKVIIGDLNQGPLAGILRIIPIERLNALLVITPQPKYLDDAKKWIEAFDQGGSGTGQRLYVYQVKNGRADKLAPLLAQAFGAKTQAPAPAEPQLAPGRAPVFLGGPVFTPAPPFGGATPLPQQGLQVSPQAVTQLQPVAAPPGTAAPAAATRAGIQPGAQSGTQPGVQSSGVSGPVAGVAGAPGAAAADDGGVGLAKGVSIVADKDNNLLLIVATPAEHAIIEAALAKLDIAPRQVMIDLTIVEVLLRDEFRFGVEWYFSAGLNVRGNLAREGGSAADLFPPFAAGAESLATSRGFNVAWRNLNFPGGIEAVINMLAVNSKTKIISNPHIIATDNQRALIKVGDRIPIEVQNVLPGVGNVVTTTTQYLDTGILVTVTPKINAGGLVTLELAAEVSDPGVRSTTSAPPINSRSAETLLTVQSGETMVLAGLIRENRAGANEGIPLLSEIPLLGSLFGTQTYDNNRTELVFFITPRVVASDADARLVAEELRKKMERIGELFPRLKDPRPISPQLTPPTSR